MRPCVWDNAEKFRTDAKIEKVLGQRKSRRGRRESSAVERRIKYDIVTMKLYV